MTNPKRFRIWDSSLIADNYSTLVQMQYQIETLIAGNKEDIGPEDLPPSMVPTEVLYSVALCYEMMYDMLVKAELVDTGNAKPNNATIH